MFVFDGRSLERAGGSVAENRGEQTVSEGVRRYQGDVGGSLFKITDCSQSTVVDNSFPCDYNHKTNDHIRAFCYFSTRADFRKC